MVALFEAVRKQKVNFKFNKNPKMRVAWLENTNQALKFIIADGVKLVNIDAQNIVDRDLKLVLGLLWTLILKYQISRNKADALKKALLEWVNSKVVEHKVKNFSSDRNDGNTLCELISKLEPDFIDMNEANGKPVGDERIEYAENIAEEMNIPPIIDPKEWPWTSRMSSRSWRPSRTTATTRRRSWRRTVRMRCSPRRILRSVRYPDRVSRRARCMSSRRSQPKRRTRRTITSSGAGTSGTSRSRTPRKSRLRSRGQGQQRRHVRPSCPWQAQGRGCV